jgi:hypothetical protein
MKTPIRDSVLCILALIAGLPLAAQSLDQAEVRLPYGELKQLLAAAAAATVPKPEPEAPPPVLVASHLLLGIADGEPFIEATCRVVGFGGGMAFVPLVGGDVSLEKTEPGEALVVSSENALGLLLDGAGSRTVTLRLLPSSAADGFNLTLPPCPSIILETAGLPDGWSVRLRHEGREETIGKNQRRPIPGGAGRIHIRMLDDRETEAALRPPEPSVWSWQHQALVMPEDDALFYQISARASASSGSGVSAQLPLPREAREVTVSGADLVSHSMVRGDDRAQSLSLVWGTRDLLDRRIEITYRMPRGPLDRKWTLHAPGDGDTRTRFMIAVHPLLSYEAETLSPPRAPHGVDEAAVSALGGGLCRFIEGETTAEIGVTLVPVAETAEGVITKADWSLKIEPDGAMLATGLLAIDHKGPFDLEFDTPAGMKLLSCDIAGQRLTPVDLGGGRIRLSLPANGTITSVVISFTGRGTALDPVEGTLELALPETPAFIHALAWALELPAGYQAETHGNLKRSSTTDKASASRIHLTKNLCRGERPEVRVFYQRADIRR